MNLELLKEPFPEDQIEWRIGKCGKGAHGVWAILFAYVSARDIQDRLDEACGAENWMVHYRSESSGDQKGMICVLSIQVSQGVWIAKEDGSEQTNVEAFKGGISSALKRAGVVWGIGRYLYGLGTSYAEIVSYNAPGAQYARSQETGEFYWKPPRLPSWAIPRVPGSVPPASGNGPAPTPPLVEIKKLPVTKNVTPRVSSGPVIEPVGPPKVKWTPPPEEPRALHRDEDDLFL